MGGLLPCRFGGQSNGSPQGEGICPRLPCWRSGMGCLSLLPTPPLPYQQHEACSSSLASSATPGADVFEEEKGALSSGHVPSMPIRPVYGVPCGSPLPISINSLWGCRLCVAAGGHLHLLPVPEPVRLLWALFDGDAPFLQRGVAAPIGVMTLAV